MNMRRKLALVAALAVTIAVQGPVAAKTDFGRFPLLKAVPADAFVAVAARANAERAFLDKYWSGVTQAFMESGVLQDIWDLIADAMSDEQLEQVEEIQDQFTSLCAEIEWGTLFDREMVHIGRMVMPQGPVSSMYEGALLGRMDEKRAAANYLALKGVLSEVVKLVESHGNEGVITLVEQKIGGLTLAGIMPAGAAGPMLSVGYCKDVIGISFGGDKILPECMDLLFGKGDKKGLASTERFRNAFKDLPAAEDELSFFDPSQMFGRMNSFLKMISGQVGQKAGTGPSGKPDKPLKAVNDLRVKRKTSKKTAHKDQAHDQEDGEHEPDDDPSHDRYGDESGDEEKAMLSAIIKVLDDISIVDYVASVQWTDGYRVYTQHVTSLDSRAADSPLYKVLAVDAACSGFDRMIPREATNFSCRSGIDFSALYQYARDFVETTVPGGKEMWAEFVRMQKEEWELDIEKDVLDLFTGSFTSVTMDQDWVLMFGVTDEKAAVGRVKELLGRLNDVLGPDQSVRMSPVKIIKGIEFTQLSHPMMMMMAGFSPPVIGSAEGRLILASGAGAVKKCVQTARGKHADIRKNKRFTAEGLLPSSGERVDSINFSDESKTAEELQQVCGMMSMVMGFAGIGMQEAPPQVRAIFAAIPQILAKLGPVCAKLNFFQSSASYSTFDGKRWVTRSVQNYKDPKELEEAEEQAPAADVESDDE